MSAYEHLFTVFTPTCNRAGTLERVYSSLEAQTFRDFEWLIVDDACTDNTRALVGWLLYQRDVRRNAALLRAIDG